MVNVSTLGQSMDQISRLKTIQNNIDNLSFQLASGKKTNEFKGLGGDVLTSQRSRATLNEIATYQQNIKLGDIKINVMTRSVQEAIAQIQNMVGVMTNQVQEGEIELDAVSDMAKDIYDRFSNILNTKYENKYLFSGSDTTTRPINDIGAMDSYMQTSIDDWINANITTSDLINQYGSANDTTLGFSASLASGNARSVFIRADKNMDVDYTVFANEQPFSDAMKALKLIANLDVLDKISIDPDDPTSTVTAPGANSDEQQQNFYQLFEEVTSRLDNSIVEMRKIEVRLTRAQLDIKSQEEKHMDDSNMLTTLVDDIENADITEVATKINMLQLQLEASFRVTSILQNMSLSNYMV